MLHQALRSQVSNPKPLLYVAEASSLGLKAGEWPKQIRISGLVPDNEAVMFDKTFVKFGEFTDADGDLVKVNYHAEDGTGGFLVVYND